MSAAPVASDPAKQPVHDEPPVALPDPTPDEVPLHPTTMYGCNKLYCEHLGRYYSQHYKQLLEARSPRVDFRCLRFPGLISAVTVPSGGTSDYAPEMIHAAARGEPYRCFVRKDTRIPFMAMPDAIEALLRLAAVPRARLTRTAYNLTAFSPTAEEICEVVTRAFPRADARRLEHRGDAARQEEATMFLTRVFSYVGAAAPVVAVSIVACSNADAYPGNGRPGPEGGEKRFAPQEDTSIAPSRSGSHMPSSA